MIQPSRHLASRITMALSRTANIAIDAESSLIAYKQAVLQTKAAEEKSMIVADQALITTTSALFESTEQSMQMILDTMQSAIEESENTLGDMSSDTSQMLTELDASV